MKEVEFGPQLKRKSDYKKEDIKTIEKMVVRLSDATGDILAVKDSINLNGGVVEDSFTGITIKRATKVQKL